MEKGDIYFWERNFPVSELGKDIRNRHYEVLTKSLTHIYIRNLRTGNTFNFPIDRFKKEFVVSPMIARK